MSGRRGCRYLSRVFPMVRGGVFRITANSPRPYLVAAGPLLQWDQWTTLAFLCPWLATPVHTPLKPDLGVTAYGLEPVRCTTGMILGGMLPCKNNPSSEILRCRHIRRDFPQFWREMSAGKNLPKSICSSRKIIKSWRICLKSDSLVTTS